MFWGSELTGSHADMKKNTQPQPVLDPGFIPPVLFNRMYRESARRSGKAAPLVIGLEREAGRLSRYETIVLDDASPDTLKYVERLAKFLLWARGGFRVFIGGPRVLADHLRRVYSPGGARAFDADMMRRVYERPLDIVGVAPGEVPNENESQTKLGGNLDGCRIGFDLGASDYKIAAVRDGEAVYSDEFPWDPKNQPDPAYHLDHISRGLKKAAAHLPRVDAIGGSSAGVIVNNRIMVASLFRAVPAARFDEARNIFLRLQRDWGVPLEVANDGDVTALAGGMSLKVNGILGIALGSSEAAGYLDPAGRMTGWLSELAFAPADLQTGALADEWSGDTGVGCLYFSQQAVNRLLGPAGIEAPPDMGLPERLKLVQSLMAKDDPRAARIYESIGVYLGYTIPYYAEFYKMNHVLILGRVTSGTGGDIIIRTAKQVLETVFAEEARGIELHVPDEKSKRVGQAVAAASLPALKR